MPRYIALLRAINVGGHVVKMDRLRGLFEGLGFSGVETFIASGNVVFESGARDAGSLERTIEAHLRGELGYDVKTFLRTPAQLAAVARHEPFPGVPMEGAALYIAFLGHQPAPGARRALLAFGSDVQSFAVRQREVYCLLRQKVSESPFSGANLEKTLGQAATMRNATTVRKLALKYPA
jgi:uncharacterized protein (DUF1697 family)